MLDSVIREVGLDGNVKTQEDRERLIIRLREQIEIESGAANRRTAYGSDIYSITYQNAERDVAFGVVDTLLRKYIDETLGANEAGGAVTEQFLDDRVQEYEARLEQAERAVANFKRENSDRLPGAEGDYFTELQNELDSLAAANRELRVLEAKRQQHLQQIEQQSSTMTGVSPGGAEPAPNSLDARIRDYQMQLDEALLEYTERHPDVIALRKTLNALKAEREAQLRELGISNSEIELMTLQANPVYQALQIALNETDIAIAALRTEIAERSDKASELKALINEVPEVEAQLARLERDYEVVYEQYLALVRSREAQGLTQAASNVDQIDFRIIDPPLASPNPVGPNRLLYMAVILFGSLGAGVVFVYLLAQLRPVFTSSRTLREIAELPVLGAVSYAWPERLQIDQRAELRRFGLSMSTLVAVFVLLSALEQFGPGIHFTLG